MIAGKVGAFVWSGAQIIGKYYLYIYAYKIPAFFLNQDWSSNAEEDYAQIEQNKGQKLNCETCITESPKLQYVCEADGI